MRVFRFLRKLALSLLSLAVMLALAEMAARSAEPGPFSFLDRNPFTPDTELVWVQTPGFRGRWEDTWYEIDSRGLRGPELPAPDEEGVFRVVALGDSCTAGKGVLEEETWSRALERLLEGELGEGLRPSVANLGVVGYSGRQYLASFLRTGLALRPQVVVVGYNLNDFPNSIEAVDQRVFHERKLRAAIPVWLRDGLSRTALYRFARATYYEWELERDWQQVERVASGLSDSVQDPSVLERERGYLAAIVESARGVGAEVLVLLFPYESQVYLAAYDPRPVDGLRGICEGLDVPFLDLTLVFREAASQGSEPARGFFLRGDRYHPSARGYRIVAEAVLAALRKQGWMPRGGG